MWEGRARQGDHKREGEREREREREILKGYNSYFMYSFISCELFNTKGERERERKREKERKREMMDKIRQLFFRAIVGL
jgi:hypothetical protein